LVIFGATDLCFSMFLGCFLDTLDTDALWNQTLASTKPQMTSFQNTSFSSPISFVLVISLSSVFFGSLILKLNLGAMTLWEYIYACPPTDFPQASYSLEMEFYWENPNLRDILTFLVKLRPF
jgi:hypothetical protein